MKPFQVARWQAPDSLFPSHFPGRRKAAANQQHSGSRQGKVHVHCIECSGQWRPGDGAECDLSACHQRGHASEAGGHRGAENRSRMRGSLVGSILLHLFQSRLSLCNINVKSHHRDWHIILAVSNELLIYEIVKITFNCAHLPHGHNFGLEQKSDAL